MAFEEAMSTLMKNLQAMLDDKQLINPSLRNHITKSQYKLQDLRKLLKEAEGKQTEAKQTNPQTIKLDGKKESNLLQLVYSIDDEVETFHIITELQRRKFYAKLRPLARLFSLQIQSLHLARKLKKFVADVDNACAKTDGEGSVKNKIVGDQDGNSKLDGSEQDSVKSSIPKKETEEPAKEETEKPAAPDKQPVHLGIEKEEPAKEETEEPAASDKHLVHTDGRSEPIEQPPKERQQDADSAGHIEPGSSEVRPRSLSDPQQLQTPEPNLQQSAAAPSSPPSSQQPATEGTSQQSEAIISDEKRDVQTEKQQISGELGTQTSGPTMSEEKRAPRKLSSNSDQLDDDSDFVGRKLQANELVQQIRIRHKLRYLISVVGDAGCGKTTFVRNIYNKTDTAQHFQLRAWVNVSEEFPEEGTTDDDQQKTKNLLIDILRQVTTIKEGEKLTLDKLEEKVRDFFIRKRFLIVLDDVKTSVIWESIKRTFPNSLNGSRMILITRDKKIAEKMNDQESTPLHLQNLDEDESWALFLKKVGPKGEGYTDESLKQLISEKCKGLPLAIVVLGGLLSNKDSSSWLKMVERIKFGDDPSKAILALAYEDLAPELKSCLLYLGLFRKDYEIPVRRLLLLWAAEGFGSSGEEIPEVVVERYLQELIKRNMIEVSKRRLDGSPKKCRVPGVLYDNVFPDAAEIGFFHVLRPQKQDGKGTIRRVAAYGDISNSLSDPRNYNLRSYFSFNTRKGDTPADEIDRFINKIVEKRGFGLLTVLDLESVYKPVLSETIGKLVHLTYLGLRWTFLDSIPNSVGNLPGLETLDVKHTNITSLPVSIWNSKKLRHLYMNEIYLDLSLQKPLAGRSLANLLTLWGLIIGKRSLGKDWLDSLLGLKKLGLTCHSESLGQITPWISKLTNLQSLKLRSIDEFSRPADLKLEAMNSHNVLSELYLLGKLLTAIADLKLPESLKMLTLSVSELKEDPMQHLGKLPQLKILRLFACSYTGKKMTCQANHFPQLRVLKLWKLEQLEEWTVEKGSMPLLKELEIRLCEKLTETNGLQNLTTLKEVTLTNMPKEFIEKNMKGIIFTVNTWDFAPLPKQKNTSVQAAGEQNNNSVEAAGEQKNTSIQAADGQNNTVIQAAGEKNNASVQGTGEQNNTSVQAAADQDQEPKKMD